MHRFLVPSLGPASQPLALPSDEAGHLARVLRLRPGKIVVVFDGRGHEAAARVETVDRRAVTVALVEPPRTVPEPSVALTLAQAILKGEKMDDVVRDAAMLGVSAIQPIVSARSEPGARAAGGGRRIERWRRIAVASIKQCQGAYVPDVRTPLEFGAFVEGEDAPARLMLVEPASGVGDRSSLEALERRAPRAAAVLIGPEGGWEPREIALASERGFVPLTLGCRTLRADAAPIVALAILKFVWGDM